MPVEFTRHAERDCDDLDDATMRAVVESLERVANGDFRNVRKLAGQSHRFRIRVGRWRVVFSRVPDGVILVNQLLQRKDAYRN
jgi:mRNA-degrading endonuclease RelE of RelBE toxin-antitoxin system